tara:strand:+ start:365 stop:556 length:192 start_codon:yes stop_codon:yes gene_type:complete
MIENGEDDAYYTVVLVNPSSTVEAIGPIVHQMVSNLKGSDLASASGGHMKSDYIELTSPELES